LWTLMTVASLARWGNATTVVGQENREREQVLGARLERLEQAVHQLAERVEHAGPVTMEHRMMMPPQMQAPLPQQAQMPGPQLQAGARPMPCPLKSKGCGMHLLKVLIPLIVIINILLAVWVFSDIRKRGEGHGIFIVLALIAGIPGAILYALVRLGDRVGDKNP